jgi:hypothetical protein
MKTYSRSVDAIFDLQKKGFVNDFHLSGNDLFWVQEHLLIRVGEFAIAECYKVGKSKNRTSQSMVFGIVALHHNIKGILISHLKAYLRGMPPPVLVKKLNEMRTPVEVNRE